MTCRSLSRALAASRRALPSASPAPQRATRGLFALALGALALAVHVFAASPAHAYGIATHAWLAEEASIRIARADPTLSFLETDPDARACFIYGAFYPDVRSIAWRAPSFNQLTQGLARQSFVRSVSVDTTDVDAAFRAFATHDGNFVLRLVERAKQTGDRYKIAFALGNLTHVLQDKHAQVMVVPELTQAKACGDLGVEVCDDPSRGPWFTPGGENELLIEGFGDQLRPHATLEFLRDAPWRLHANETISYQRALALRRFHYETAVLHTQAAGTPPPSELGVMNGARLYDMSCTFYPTFTGHVPPDDTMRLFIFRYVELEWWAQLVNGVGELLTQNLTGARDPFELLAPLVPIGIVGDQVGASSPIAELLFAHAHGPAEAQRVEQKYALNPELPRLQQSGFLDPATYDRVRYEDSHILVVDGCTRPGTSLYTDPVRWPTYSRKAMRAAANRSLHRLGGPTGAADAATLLVYDLRYEDAATGQSVGAELRLPQDVGRTLAVEVELYGTKPDPEPRLLRLRLRADVTASAADPVLSEVHVALPASRLDPRSYANEDRPTIGLTWTVADVPGARGVYVELDEPRLTLGAPTGAAGPTADLLLSTELSPLQPLMDGRAHYQQHYSTYQRDMGSLRITR